MVRPRIIHSCVFDHSKLQFPYSFLESLSLTEPTPTLLHRQIHRATTSRRCSRRRMPRPAGQEDSQDGQDDRPDGQVALRTAVRACDKDGDGWPGHLPCQPYPITHHSNHINRIHPVGHPKPPRPEQHARSAIGLARLCCLAHSPTPHHTQPPCGQHARSAEGLRAAVRTPGWPGQVGR